MSRLTTMDPTEASGLLAETFASIKRAAGMIPNAYLTIGTHSPEGLDAVLRIDEVVAKSDISDADLEIIRLVVSEWTGCRYCIAAHSLKAHFFGLSHEITSNIREGSSTGDFRRDALVEFVRTIFSSKGALNSQSVESIIAAGYSERQIIEMSLAIASTIFISTVNRINDTEIDYPEF
ncbi:alkylhydroperoxidase [Pseudomonas agarici]|uniref:Alkylhydroperoxidase n=1 Tax=Pseudomonas agarici TaxID=46677 RepID=A0A0X1T877_PSEAA|nr:carboxymuconolactone decarboxylase family protein [Pseudomonas agarici]AMB88113.1 alkylhydroperoxidase [Pseudomonas agarici]NWB93006.1 carboxymuconolactone decarboxylase family protein [Pseudomonas agarici]NWC09273.1 carboxymuconolactone decarboxylase family protein [Pseudomonas agarici]SEK29808.1 alkylhydroperoxidase AhpD family core domain-containing protein [Pseudomonas agarici]